MTEPVADVNRLPKERPRRNETGRATEVGGIFFEARDPEAPCAWYARHLEIDVQPWSGAAFAWKDDPQGATGGSTVWSIAPESSEYGKRPFVIDYRVADLEAVLAALRSEGCLVEEKAEVSDLGAFGWVTDPEGDRVELWPPPAWSSRG